jgi:3-hydroxyisobutyrate dehydrogenase-like beta-hydroxyacid dehydrogenase
MQVRKNARAATRVHNCKANGRRPMPTLNRPSCPSQRIAECTGEPSFAQRESAPHTSPSNSANVEPARALFERAIAAGLGEEDVVALIKVLRGDA